MTFALKDNVLTTDAPTVSVGGHQFYVPPLPARLIIKIAGMRKSFPEGDEAPNEEQLEEMFRLVHIGISYAHVITFDEFMDLHVTFDEVRDATRVVMDACGMKPVLSGEAQATTS